MTCVAMGFARAASAILWLSVVAVPVRLEDTAPREVWRHFARILRIPRCSGDEAAMRAYIQEVARESGLVTSKDTTGNLIVKRHAQGVATRTTAPVIIQTHLDMVCEKNSNSLHDWARDPIVTTVRDGWLVADETTLGSDNGVGVAMALALMQAPDDAVLPPLEFVFTVEEETGLTGATNLDVSLLDGRRLLNFDSEEFGIIYIGCAGGGAATVSLPVQSSPLDHALLPFALELKGLQGGHSGADIHVGRGNALLLIARAVDELQHVLPSVRLLHLEGGNKDNAIPRESFATVGLKPDSVSHIRSKLADIELNLRKEFGRIEPGLDLQLGEEPIVNFSTAPLDERSALRLLDLVLGLPYGPLKMSHEVLGLVETSNNVAKVRRVSPELVQVDCFPRSSIDSAFEHAQDRIRRVARLCGATVNRSFSFPGWAPNSSQALLALAEDEFTKLVGSKPQVSAIHAGLECGIIGGKLSGIEMISFGPDIKGAHAPGERVELTSVERTWHLGAAIA